MAEQEEKPEKIEFMRKSRFETVQDKFTDISPEANSIIEKANPNDILLLSVTFNSLHLETAEVVDENKFIELAF